MRVVLAVLVICVGLWHEGCGPGLRQQVQLRALSDRATTECQTVSKPCPDMAAGSTPACLLARSRCLAALACAKSVATAETDIQALQKARAGSGATADLGAVAAGSEASARTHCRNGGWQ